MKIMKGKTNIADDKGFTLVETMFVMLVSSFLFLITFKAYSVVLNESKASVLYDNTRTLQGAVTEYKAIMGRYPCPADPTLGPGDANYGVENCAINIVGVGRDADEDGDDDNILIGSYPFETILEDLGTGIQSEMTAIHTLDPWKNKYTYAVTENLTNVITYNDAFGTIRIVDEFRESVITPEDRAHLVIYSHGENGRGGYSAEGTLIDPFIIIPLDPPPDDGEMALNETENANNDGIFLSGLTYDQNAPFPNDDFMSFMINQTSGLWQIVGGDFTDPDNPTFYVSNLNPGSVGVGVLDPTEQLEIAGNIRNNTEIRAINFCDEGGADCMPMTRLARNDAEMQCDPGEAVIAFENNAAVCGTVFGAGSIPVVSCPADQYLTGFSNLGTVICNPL